MAKYTADDAKSMEYQGAETFRIEKDGGRARVVFLYEGEGSVDGWGVHRLPGANFYTYTVDCPRGPKDPVDKCPACKAGETLSTRIFVRMLDIDTGKVMIWDKPASFRQTITGFMHYFPTLYLQKYEITRSGTGLNTRYNFQSIGDSGITPEQYAEYVKACDEVCDSYVRPIDKYEEIKARSEAAQNEQVSVEAQGNQTAPPQSAWGQPAPAPNPYSGQPTQQAWGQPPQPTQQPAWGNQPPAPQGNQPAQPQPWGQPPQGAWQNPQG